ncbi:hypothetical protein Tco_0267722 [Tanacetum coccineum]
MNDLEQWTIDKTLLLKEEQKVISFSSSLVDDFILVQSVPPPPTETKGFFISNDKSYVDESTLKKFDFASVNDCSTTNRDLKALSQRMKKPVSSHSQRLSHLTAVKRNFRDSFTMAMAKKQTIVATSTTEAQNMLAAAQVAWAKSYGIQNITIRGTLLQKDYQKHNAHPPPDPRTKDQREGTEEKVESTAEQKESTEEQTKEEFATQASQTSTQTPTSMIFGDDETIATLLINMSKAKAASKEKEKGVELKDVEDTDRPRPTSTRSTLTLKPLPKIDPKDKGKKKIEEEDETESEDDDIPQAVKKFKQLESDEELARKVQEEWEAEEERNKIAEEQATNEALIQDFDDIKARIEADRILAEKLQEQEREQFTIEERAKFLHDTIAAQRKFLAQQRSQAIRNKPPTKNQLRNQMITYLKHVGNFKHANLKSRKFEDIQALYEKIKRFNEHFISTGSAKDEKFLKRMNEKRVDLSKREVIKEETKEEVKDEDSTRKRKLGTRKKMKSRKRRYIQHTSEDDTDKENEELRLCLKIATDEDKEADYEILDRKYPIIDWKTECLGTKPQHDEAKTIEEINLNVVTRSNGQQRYFSVLTSVLSIFDREDLNAVYQLVMNKYQDEMPEGFERVIWGDLMVLFNPDEKDEFWSSQHEWKVISWKLHSSSGVHTLMTNEGVVIHMLTEKKYPLKKEILVQMLNLKLESEEESTMALELIRFIKKVLADLESEEQD